MDDNDPIYKLAMQIDELIANQNTTLLLASVAMLSLITFKTKNKPQIISPTHHILLTAITRELIHTLEQQKQCQKK